MAENTIGSVNTNLVRKRMARNPKGNPQNLKPWTPETAKEAAARSAYCRQMRAQMRKKLLDAAISVGIDQIYAKALKSGDLDAITVAREGMKLVGLDFASSEESVQRVQANVDAKTDNKVEVIVKGLDG